MIATNTMPKSGEGTWLWVIKILTGVLVIVILFVHFVVNHFIGETGGLLSYAQIVEYYRIPIIPIMEIAFLILVVSHSLLGLRSIILDLRPSRAVLSATNWLLSVLGVVSIVYGIWLIRAIVAQGS